MTRRTAPKYPDYVQVELRHDCSIAWAKNKFISSDDRALARLNAVLGRWDIKSIEPVFPLPKRAFNARIKEAPADLQTPVSAEFAHAAFFKIVVRRKKEMAALKEALSELPEVWEARLVYPSSPPSIPKGRDVGPRNFETAQAYLASAPFGFGIVDAWTEFGAKGRGITVCDIETSYNPDHYELRGVKYISGHQGDEIARDKDHGTAVLGQLVSKPGRRGLIGICPQARAVFQSEYFAGDINTARALHHATRKLNAGDVILLETGDYIASIKSYVAVQNNNSVASAIRAAVSKGICVVQPAHNYDVDMDAYQALRKDHGAITVGAGIPALNYYGFEGDDGKATYRYEYMGEPRSRAHWSNYGSLVNLQGWGYHVATLGYGDASGGPDENSWTTLRFDGTSAAAPIIAGMLACLQSMAKVKYGVALTPADARERLVSSAWEQVKTTPQADPIKNIGPQPDLLSAIRDLHDNAP